MELTKVETEKRLQTRWLGATGRTTLPRSIHEKDDLDIAVAASELVHQDRCKAEFNPGDRCQVLDVSDEGDTGLWFDCTYSHTENNLFYGNFGKKKSWNARGYERKHIRPAIIRIDYQLPRRHPNSAAFHDLVGAVRFDRVQLSTGEKAFILVNDIHCYKIEIIINKKVRRVSYLKVISVTKQPQKSQRISPSESVFTTQRAPSIGPVKRKLSEFMPNAFRVKTTKQVEESVAVEQPRISNAQKQRAPKSSVKRRANSPATTSSIKRCAPTIKTEGDDETVEPRSQKQLFSSEAAAELDHTRMMPFCDPGGDGDFSAGEMLVGAKLDTTRGNKQRRKKGVTDSKHSTDCATKHFNSPQTHDVTPALQRLQFAHEQPKIDRCESGSKDSDWFAKTSDMTAFKESIMTGSNTPPQEFTNTTMTNDESVSPSALLGCDTFELAEEDNSLPQAVTGGSTSTPYKPETLNDSVTTGESLLPFPCGSISTPHKSGIRDESVTAGGLETLLPFRVCGSISTPRHSGTLDNSDTAGGSQPLLPFPCSSISTPYKSETLDHSEIKSGRHLLLSVADDVDVGPVTPSAVSKICSLAELDLSSASGQLNSTASPTDHQLKLEDQYDFGAYDDEEDENEQGASKSPTTKAYDECRRIDLRDIPQHRIYKGERPLGSQVVLFDGMPGCVVWFSKDTNHITEPMAKLAVRKAASKQTSADRLYFFMNSLVQQLCRTLPRPHLFGEPPIGKFSDQIIPTAIADEQPPPFRDIINAAITKYNVKDAQAIMFRRAVYSAIFRIKKNKRNQKHHHRNKFAKK